MLKIKICGITNVADALLASEEGVDFIGLIFAPSSRRIDVDTAKEIVSEMPEGVVPVGVFQDQPVEEVRNILTTCGIRFAQLHGNESVDYAASLGAHVIKAFDTYTDQTLEIWGALRWTSIGPPVRRSTGVSYWRAD
jgi:phosphoribosylanthranilate isomerase